MNVYIVEYTDTFAGEANYSWVRRATITMPEITHHGYDGIGYGRANCTYRRELMRKAKAAVGLTGVRGQRSPYGDGEVLYPANSNTVLFVYPAE